MKLAAGRADEGGGGWDGRRQMATRPRTGTELGAGHHVAEEVFSSLSVQWMVACSLAKWVSAIRGGGFKSSAPWARQAATMDAVVEGSGGRKGSDL
jgi:hypothetical protein